LLLFLLLPLATIDDDVDGADRDDGVSSGIVDDEKRVSIATPEIYDVADGKRRPGNVAGEETVRTPARRRRVRAWR